MSVFGLDALEVRSALEAVSCPDGADAAGAEDDGREPVDPLRDDFARVAWSVCIEPGDGAAGAVIAALGAAGALRALTERWDSRRLLTALREGGVDAGLTPETAGKALARWRPRVSSARVLEALRHAARIGAVLLTPRLGAWPRGVDDLAECAPPALWLRGDPAVCARLGRSLALVGARAATGYGEHVALEAAAGLSDRGMGVVSGAAYGIDGAAHRAALASGGDTLAFLAGGVDRLYPAGHDGLLREIIRSGAVLAESPCGTAPSRWRFLQRNRLIAAAARATVVVEAGRRSGSLNTAAHAASLGRPLGAVPGPVTSPASRGCHRLLREYDATCVTDAREMAELVDGLDPNAGPEGIGVPGGPGPDEVRLLDALGTRTARRPEELARRSGLSVGEVSALLGGLQLDGLVRERSGGWVGAGTPSAVARNTRHPGGGPAETTGPG